MQNLEYIKSKRQNPDYSKSNPKSKFLNYWSFGF